MRKLMSVVIAFASTLFAAAFSVPPAVAAGAAASKGDKAVLAALEDWKTAMLKQDRAALEKLFHPDLSYGHSSATLQTKPQAITGAVDSPGWEAMEFVDTTVRMQGNVAIVNGKLDMHQRNKGKPTTISKLINLTVWVKGPQGWQMIARQAVRRPDDEQVIAAKAALAATSAGKTPAPAPAK
jgi:ketosteroid isomerase-like protein